MGPTFDGHTIRKQKSYLGERHNARNNARCTQARKTTHGMDGQHQDMDWTPRERVNQRTEKNEESTVYVHGVANPRMEDG